MPNYDSDDPRPWILAVRTPATLAHAIAILTTIFRLLYRQRLSRFSWEDIWAILALICDFGCLAGIWLQAGPAIPHAEPPIDLRSSWLLSLTITSIVWFARMSILSSIVQIANPTEKLRFVAHCIGSMFLAMEAGLLAQKIYICIKRRCFVAVPVAIAQLVNTTLVAVSIRFFRDVRLDRDRRILVTSAFSASILITAVTILHSVLLFQEATNATIIIGHVKAALALFVCNSLVLVTLVYRLYRRSVFDPEYSIPQGSEVGSNVVQFTSVIALPSKISSVVHPIASGIHRKWDAAITEEPTSNTSSGLELDAIHIRN